MRTWRPGRCPRSDPRSASCAATSWLRRSRAMRVVRRRPAQVAPRAESELGDGGESVGGVGIAGLAAEMDQFAPLRAAKLRYDGLHRSPPPGCVTFGDCTISGMDFVCKKLSSIAGIPSDRGSRAVI